MTGYQSCLAINLYVAYFYFHFENISRLNIFIKIKKIKVFFNIYMIVNTNWIRTRLSQNFSEQTLFQNKLWQIFWEILGDFQRQIRQHAASSNSFQSCDLWLFIASVNMQDIRTWNTSSLTVNRTCEKNLIYFKKYTKRNC